jgi:hypothetical protein
MQEVACLIHRMGEGISQAIGTGGRDLSAEVAGKTFLFSIEALLQDEETDVIILMSKHCDKNVAAQMVERCMGSQKHVVIYFPGSDSLIDSRSGRLYKAFHLEHVAALSVALARGESPPPPVTQEIVLQEMLETIARESGRFSPVQKYVRALFAGGTFVDQARIILPVFFDRVYTYPAHERDLSLDHPLKSKEHCIVDLGDDYFTRGKLHPMMDPTPRIERIAKEMEDMTIRVILLDVMLGYGSHEDPSRALTEIISRAKSVFEKQGSYLSFIVSLCGTEGDPQNFQKQKSKLENCGALVADSSTRAVILAGLIGSR